MGQRVNRPGGVAHAAQGSIVLGLALVFELASKRDYGLNTSVLPGVEGDDARTREL